MTTEQCFREECDTIRLLIEEFGHVGGEYFVRNMDAINTVESRDWNEYVKPKAIPSLLGFLAGSLLVHCISLLDFRLPKLVIYRLGATDPNAFSKFESTKGGNVLDRMKQTVKSEDFNFDFGDDLYERLRAWILIRNDEVHNGGYRGEKVTQHHIDILHGVNVGDVGCLYDIQFVACEHAINDIEAFFQKTHDSLVRRESRDL